MEPIKTLALIKRKQGTSREAFRDHYESVHVPLALPLLGGLRRYVRYHVLEVLYGDFNFDVLTYFRYANKAATEAVFQVLSAPEGQPILDDEQTFMEKTANRFFAVSERQLAGEVAGESDRSVFVLASRSLKTSRFDASAKIVRELWPDFAPKGESPDFALLRDAFPMEGGDLPFDQILQLSPDSRITKWAKSLEAAGYRVTVVETSRQETPLLSSSEVEALS